MLQGNSSGVYLRKQKKIKINSNADLSLEKTRIMQKANLSSKSDFHENHNHFFYKCSYE